MVLHLGSNFAIPQRANKRKASGDETRRSFFAHDEVTVSVI
jgi:hypothetical protein